MKPRLKFASVLAGIAAVLTIVGGVTFAALRSQENIISVSSLTSVSANLQMAQTANGNWVNTLPGYSFSEIVPGGEPGPKNGNQLYLKNAGSSALNPELSLNPASLYNPNGINLQKVHLVIYDDTGVKLASPSIAELWDAHAKGDHVSLQSKLLAGATGHYVIRMQIEDGAVGGSSLTSQLSVTGIDLLLTGEVVTV